MDKLHKLRQEIAHFHKFVESNIYGRLLGEKTQITIRTKMVSSVKYLMAMETVLYKYFKNLTFEKRLFNESLKNLGLKSGYQGIKNQNARKVLHQMAVLRNSTHLHGRARTSKLISRGTMKLSLNSQEYSNHSKKDEFLKEP